jgi:hypothetical protein
MRTGGTAAPEPSMLRDAYGTNQDLIIEDDGRVREC